MIEFLNKLNMRWTKLSGESRAIFHGISWVAIFLLAAKSIAAVKELLVAKHYGASALLDGYLFAFNVANWPILIFANMASNVLVPILVNLHARNRIGYSQFKRELLLGGFACGVFMGVISWFLMPQLLDASWVGLNDSAKKAAHQAIPFVSVMVPFGVVSAIYSAYLMSEQRHANTFLDGAPSLIIMIALFSWPWGSNEISLVPILWGTLLGFVVQALWLARLNKSKEEGNFSCERLSKYWGEVSKSSLHIGLTQFLIFTAIFVDQIFLARLPEGNISGYGYAYRVILLILGLSSTALARAILPILTGMDNYEKKCQLIQAWAIRVFWIGLMVAILLMVFSNPIIEILFERGRFTKDDTQLVSWIFVIFLIQLPFALSFTVLTQWFLSEKNLTRELFWVTLICITLKICCGALAVSFWDWGSLGVAFSYTIYNGFGLLLLVLLFLRNVTARK
jgi:putative peptidoglycan lipid II flippase